MIPCANDFIIFCPVYAMINYLVSTSTDMHKVLNENLMYI